MAAARTQKRVTTSKGSTSGRTGSGRRASSTRARSASIPATRSGSARPSTPRTRSTSAGKKAPARRRAGVPRWLASALIAVSLVLAAWMVYPVLRMQYQHERELQTLQGELDGLKTRNEVLREQVDGLKTPAGVEQLARESLGMVKSGEQAYVVTGGTLGEASSSVLATGTVEAPLMQRVLDALFGFR